MDIKKLKGKELTNFLAKKLDSLADDICQDPEELLNFVERWNQGFHNYSFNNIILAWFQRPGFSLLAGYKAWQKKGRQVKRGEKAIRILAPMTQKIHDDKTDDDIYMIKGFRAVNVFDVGQTEGDPLDLGCSDLIKGSSKYSFDDIRKAAPVPVEVTDLGKSNGRTNGSWIKVSPRDNESSMITTLIHEMGHIKLGHVDKKGIVLNETDDQSAHEVEAETVSFIVSQFLGLENQKSRLYVGAWGGNKAELQGRGKKIITVAEQIIKGILEVNN